MTDHARHTIRDKVVAALDNLTTTKKKVYASRTWPLEDGTIPGLIVYVDREDIDETMGKLAKIQHRNLEIKVVGRDKLASGLDDQLDKIAAEVETAMFGANLGKIYGLDLVGIETAISDGLEMPVGEITLTFRAQYLTMEGAPTAAI